ncbi:MAG: 50S ribosomal protein L11 methyltransferase, partial [Firmicutes bacterium]|nr:50S ribosomal protein L11 methyltransferase [Bacillota bacterium]
DMGCGSGILGICSRKIGAGFITAVDIDENAVRIAEENFIANNCKKGSFEVRCGDAVTDKTFADSIDSDFDFICANIVAGVIVSLAEFFWDKLKNDGILIASGIITERQKEVTDALQRAGFTVISITSREDWSEITCKK